MSLRARTILVAVSLLFFGWLTAGMATAVGAGVGEIVLYCQGSAARQTPQTQNRPVDGVIMAIVDQLAVHDEVRYTKE